MDEISKFFKGLYYQFLLRDIAAKVIPGTIALMFLAFLLFPDLDIGDSFAVPFIAGSSLVAAIAFYGLGLMLGMLLQFIGDRTYTFGKRNVQLGPRTFSIRSRSFTFPKIKFSLPAIDWRPIVLRVWGSEEETMKQELNFQHYASMDYVRMKRERLVIFKEMAGTYAMAFIVALIAYIVAVIVGLFNDFSPEIGSVILTVVLLLLVIGLLSRQNKALAEEQRRWEKAIIDSKGALPVAKTAQAAKPTARKTKS